LNNLLKNIAIWVAIALLLMTVFNQFNGTGRSSGQVVYSQFMQEVRDGRVAKVQIDGRSLHVTTNEGKNYDTFTPSDPWLVSDLLKNNVIVEAKPEEHESMLMSIFVSWFPMILLIGVWIFFMRQMQGGGKGGGPFSFGKSKARQLDESNNSTTFADVAGCDEAKEEVAELVELPFFSISGSDFVEMFVGVGAARVRDMFETAKKNSPCIVFIDEIDAVGRHRGAGTGGGNDEREQTLNQMLVEMDGFEANSGVIVIAATNRADVLDKALLRPGRFDRQVMVGLPDIKGREQILNVHMRKVPIDPDVKADILARGTPGFSGADLANLVNEAALFAARRNKRTVDMQDFEDAKDKIFMGPERKSMVMREEERLNTAYHESGHAVVAKLLPKADPVHKVTIMPRGWALGLTWQLPEHDRISNYKDKMLEDISILFGGRIAEEIFMNQMSTGASNDFERATKMARDMVTKFGMSDTLGTMVYAGSEQDSWMGSMSSRTVSEATQQKVDAEIRRILDEQYGIARKLLEDNRDKVEAMTKALMEFETIDADQVNDIMAGLPVRAPKPKNGPTVSSGGSGSGTMVNPTPQPTAKGDDTESNNP